jgi:hypothetical protein
VYAAQVFDAWLLLCSNNSMMSSHIPPRSFALLFSSVACLQRIGFASIAQRIILFNCIPTFKQKLPVSFQFNLIAPVTILGFLEQAAANTFFHPELIATTVASWARLLGFKAQ